MEGVTVTVTGLDSRSIKEYTLGVFRGILKVPGGTVVNNGAELVTIT